MIRRVLVWGGAFVLLVLLLGLAVTAFLLRPESIRARAEAEIASRLRLETTFEDLRVSLFPTPRVTGAGLTLRAPGRSDLPAFIAVRRFDVSVGLLSAFRWQVDTVRLEGLEINVPPREARGDLPDRPTGVPESPIVIRHLVSHDAVLRFIPREAGKTPLSFELHDLAVDDLGFTREMPFQARLTNPVPRGLIETSGLVGPWRPEDPTALPLAGLYTLRDADLGTINGLGGILQSEGQYEGLLTEIRATGTTTMPDFSLNIGGRALPLDSTYVAIVDGTNGSVTLESVDATLASSTIKATGAITNLAGPIGHDIEILSEVIDGRIEDMLALSIDSPEPLLTGALTSSNTLKLPPGDTPVRDRLRIEGRFGLGEASFTDANVSEKLAELSRRSQGQSEDEAARRVLSNLSGDYTMAAGVFTARNLRFLVPGADIRLAGTYELDSETLNFEGELRMEASVSEAMGGIKGIILKPFDFIFRRDGAGAVVPISIKGTWREPDTNLDWGRIFR